MGSEATPPPAASTNTTSQLYELLNTNALLNAGPVGFAAAQACECGWLVFDVKVAEADSSQAPHAANIEYRTRWVRTNNRPVLAITTVNLGPFVATAAMFPSAPLLSGSALSVESVSSYPLQWNGEFGMKTEVTVANAVIGLLYQHADGITDLLTDWSTAAPNPWPWLDDPKALCSAPFFVPYAYEYSLVFKVRGDGVCVCVVEGYVLVLLCVMSVVMIIVG